jgi:hypothetical protein
MAKTFGVRTKALLWSKVRGSLHRTLVREDLRLEAFTPLFSGKS